MVWVSDGFSSIEISATMGKKSYIPQESGSNPAFPLAKGELRFDMGTGGLSRLEVVLSFRS